MKCEKLDVWKKSCRVSVEIYKYFADCKDFGLKDQITRSSLSVPSNIAEGMEKTSIKDKIRYLDIAKGSASELITQIYIGIEVGYIEKDVGMQWKKEINSVLGMLSNLQKNLTPST